MAFRMISKPDKHLVLVIMKKKDRTVIHKIINEMGDITTNTTEIQSIKRDNHEQP